ncbi:NADP-dependent phosphogluconate dehydrogenase [Clostridium transplantifaecale]|uniref:NADP-dependent phosphogluconate dehydrogenase n=1 Tax=Clostridium transplantifaecale TaxID=2479838 RepID=UPI000F62ED91|nr:NADP-dependent phosphogluconate dehydrogenase [Clostridium transplantifaecale]
MERKCEIGLLGLGVMGSSLAKNMIRNGVKTALYSVSERERNLFSAQKGQYHMFPELSKFIMGLEKPRRVFMMITAGEPVDIILDQLLSLMEAGDIIMDGGNSYYKDTERRCRICRERNIHYMGIGVSGGEKGALKGPCIMAGGSSEAWNEVKDILETIAAKQDGMPCCGYIASGGAGHYVKMVHNGIEYALLELIAEAYQYLRVVKNTDIEEICRIFKKWNEGSLNSYLMEISIRVLEKKEKDGTFLIDHILDVAEQKGTGKWTVTESVERGVYTPSIYEAQAARIFSGKKEEREKGKRKLVFHSLAFPEVTPDELGKALLMACVIAYSQGFELISKTSADEKWGIDLSSLVAIWKNGCIIRSRLLNEIEKVEYSENRALILSEIFEQYGDLEGSLRKMTVSAVAHGLPVPGFTSSLNYYDYYRSERMPMNFIQALRDCFGSHTYMREDKEGCFHTDWEQ